MSSIYNSDFNIEQLFLGSEEITEMYLGDQLVFSKITNNLFYKLHEFVGSLTVRNTVEAPVKSAILKGNTLVNVLSATNIKVSSKSAKVIAFNIQPNVQKRYVLFFKLNKIPTISDNSDNAQFLKLEWYHASASGGFYSLQNKNVVLDKTMTINIPPYTGVIQRTNFSVWCRFFESGELDMDVMIIEYQEGMENWDIPYFENMTSVKMPVLTTTGKNLIDINTLPIKEKNNCEVIDGVVYKKPTKAHEATRWVMPVKPNTTYIISVKGSVGTVQISNFLQSTSPTIDKRIQLDRGNSSVTFTTSSHTELTLSIYNPELENYEVSDIQLEYGIQKTSYEPFKSNILTCNEEVILRSNGDVYDELNLLTGKLTQRISEDNEVLSEEVHRTVDLTRVDQDGKTINKLNSFNGATHVSTEVAENSTYPMVSLEVASELQAVVKID